MHNKRGHKTSLRTYLSSLLMTSLSNCIKFLLNIKDPSLEFLAFKTETINSVALLLSLPAALICRLVFISVMATLRSKSDT